MYVVYAECAGTGLQVRPRASKKSLTERDNASRVTRSRRSCGEVVAMRRLSYQARAESAPPKATTTVASSAERVS